MAYSVWYVMTCGWHNIKVIKHTQQLSSVILIYLFAIWERTISKELFGWMSPSMILKVASIGFRKLRSSKKIEILWVFLVLQVAPWKNIFSRRKETAFFSSFHYEIFFCCAELFECAFNFKFCWNIFIFLNNNTNQTSKEQDLNFIRSSHLFWEQP